MASHLRAFDAAAAAINQGVYSPAGGEAAEVDGVDAWVDQCLRQDFQTALALRAASVALAVRLYEIDTGMLPPNLSRLSGRYLATVPADPLSRTPRRLGYTLSPLPMVYSVGTDNTDNLAQRSWTPSLEDHRRSDRPDWVFVLRDQPATAVETPASPDASTAGDARHTAASPAGEQQRSDLSAQTGNQPAVNQPAMNQPAVNQPTFSQPTLTHPNLTDQPAPAQQSAAAQQPSPAQQPAASAPSVLIDPWGPVYSTTPAPPASRPAAEQRVTHSYVD